MLPFFLNGKLSDSTLLNYFFCSTISCTKIIRFHRRHRPFLTRHDGWRRAWCTLRCNSFLIARSGKPSDDPEALDFFCIDSSPTKATMSSRAQVRAECFFGYFPLGPLYTVSTSLPLSILKVTGESVNVRGPSSVVILLRQLILLIFSSSKTSSFRVFSTYSNQILHPHMKTGQMTAR